MTKAPSLRQQLFHRKPIAMLLEDSRTHGGGLKRALGALDLTALGVGAIIGAGIFVLTGVAAAEMAGPGVIISFAVSGLASAMAALCYAEFAAMIPVAGSAYSYSYATMGELAGWIIGWDLILEYAVASAAVAVGWSGYCRVILGGLGIHLPYALSHAPGAGGGILDLPALLIVAVVTTILVIGISESARVNSIIVAVKLFAVGVVIVVGAFYVRPANWHPFVPFGWSGIMHGAAIIFFAYIGFDAVSTAAEEVIDPARDLPLGILGSLAACTLLYILVAAVLTGMTPYKTIDVNAPLSSAFVNLGLNLASATVSLGAVAGLTSVLLVMMLGQSRVFFAMSRDGLLPPIFSRIHPRFRTPYFPTILTGTAVGITAALLPIQEIAELTNIGTLFAFVLVCMGVWIMRHIDPQRARPFATPFVPLVPIAGALACGYLMLSLPVVTWMRFVVWLALGLAVYFSYGRWHSRVSRGRDQDGSSLPGEVAQPSR
ncbi:MAG TPA: amino acid permease [Candidatus Binataceae bacterium]|nr:amino acid permease [Candidatus Binataceae bacterium]